MTPPALRRVARLQRGAGFPHDEQGHLDGELPFFKVGDFSRHGNERWLRSCQNWVSHEAATRLRAVPVPSGSVLLPKIGAALLGNARRLATRWCVFDNNVLAVVPSAVESRYLHYWLSIVDLAELAQPGPVPSLDDPALLDLRLPIPAVEGQRAIADFLDTEIARIDALITKKRRMIELVNQRFGSYIRDRLAAIAPVLPLKRRWTVVDCKHRTPTYVDDGYPVVSPGDVTPGRLELARCHRFVDDGDFADLADVLRRPRRGDIIYSRNASIGIAAYVGTDRPFCMGQDVCLITSRDQNQLYLSYALNSIGLDQLELQKVGSTFSRVNVAQIVELSIPTPEVELQRSLAREFDQQRRTSDHLVGRLHQQVGLLQEHRQALITAAVTGEIEVPGVAA